MKNLSKQRFAITISSCTAFLLMVLKFAIGLFSGSIAVLSSAIDSLLDLFVSLFNNFALYLSEKRPNKKFNYGKGKIEAFAAFFEGIVIVFSGLYVYYEAVCKLISGEEVGHMGLSIIVMIISIIATLILVIYLKKVYKSTESLVVSSDLLHYETDLWTNSGIFIGLVLIHISGLYFIDSVIGIIVSAYIIVSAWDLVKKGFLLLMDVALDDDDVSKIKAIIKNHEEIKGYKDLKTRQSGETKFVEVDIEVNGDMTLVEAHEVSEEIEKDIKKIDNKSLWEVLVHVEPHK